MTPRTEAQFDAIRRKSRAAILAAALDLFARQGFAATSVAAIAARAGVSKGLLYNYFASKDDLLIALILDIVERTVPEMFRPNPEADPRAQLETLIHKTMHLITSRSVATRFFIRMHTDGSTRRLFERHAGESLNAYTGGLLALFARLGSKDPSADVHVFGSLIDGIALNYHATPKAFPVALVERRLVEMYCSPKGMFR